VWKHRARYVFCCFKPVQSIKVRLFQSFCTFFRESIWRWQEESQLREFRSRRWTRCAKSVYLSLPSRFSSFFAVSDCCFWLVDSYFSVFRPIFGAIQHSHMHSSNLIKFISWTLPKNTDKSADYTENFNIFHSEWKLFWALYGSELRQWLNESWGSRESGKIFTNEFAQKNIWVNRSCRLRGSC
jgi:hypothetical protein